MSNTLTGEDLLQTARCEDLLYEQISQVSVLGDFERKLIDALKGSGANLLEGARGVGKSMLLRMAEIELDAAFSKDRKLAVYVNFKTSTLLEGVKADERDAFQIWVNIKLLEAFHEKLLSLKLIAKGGAQDPYYRVFGVASVEETKSLIEDKIHLLQKLAFSKDKAEVITEIGSDFLSKAQDTSFLATVFRDACERFKLNKIVFFFDEAAHTFIPEQQTIFFEIFKLLHGGKIACKAAVYPTVTHYGRNFEVGQDAIILSVFRFDPGEAGRKENREHFRAILEKRLPKTSGVRKKIFTKGAELDLCIDLSNGNPRALLHIINSALSSGSLSDRSVNLAVQEYVDQALLPYHQSLSKRLPTYAAHIRVGLDLLRGYLIPEIRAKNHRKTKSEYQSAFFTLQRDMSPNLKLALDILCYSGMTSQMGTVKIAGGHTGPRYLVNLSVMATEKAFDTPRVSDAISRLSLTDYREFSSSDSQIDNYLSELLSPTSTCMECTASLKADAKYCSECGALVVKKSIVSSLLEESVDSLSLSERLRDRVRARFPTVGAVVQAKRSELMVVPYIKDVRSRIIKNAADEFISG
ncbi:ORC-CDC6 family AAA ATPase [Methylobacterium sp. Leaf106]|uniref:ORC-CDC6 family AAA ATPase n=1 Tax=Methylobacterium sp. Leaf106 TaxID=1736255 RepID=UPI0009E7C0D8|nr:zinc ribbon domain-containing protein [Methylobacterium sp. Leaf106]